METNSMMHSMIRYAAGTAVCLFLAAAAGQDIYRRQVSLFLPAVFLLPGLFCCLWRLTAEGGDLYMEAAALLPGCGLCLLAGLSDGKVGWGGWQAPGPVSLPSVPACCCCPFCAFFCCCREKRTGTAGCRSFLFWRQDIAYICCCQPESGSDAGRKTG